MKRFNRLNQITDNPFAGDPFCTPRVIRFAPGVIRFALQGDPFCTSK